MLGIVLVTHGRLAEEFRAAVEHIVGPQTQLATICIAPDDDMQLKRQEILDETARVDRGQGVVLLTDMFGGTPSNLALSVLDRAKVEVVAGLNLPMLVKLVSLRDTCPLYDAAKAAQDAGRKYIHAASQLLKEGKK